MGFPLLSGWTYSLARRLLRPWVRARVLPAQTAELGLDPAKPVCYVLQSRRLSNLVVIDEEARRAGLPPLRAPLNCGDCRSHRAFFFLTRPQPLAGGGAKDRYGHSPLLAALVRGLRSDAAADVQLVPVTVFWGQAPGKQSTILRALFAESWRPPGHLRQLFSVLVHGRHALVRFGTPLSLRELTADAEGEAQTLRKVGRVLRATFRLTREAVIGPDLSHRNLLVESIVAAPSVRAAIAAASEGEATTADAKTRARAYALEIAADYSHGVVRALELFLDWLWNRLYEGVAVHRLNVLDGIAPGSGVVYLPCHRSHVDYLLLSFVIFRNGRMPPHIAAGANLNIPLVGPILRRGGAFFLRRSFKGTPLYSAVFDEYLHSILTRGFPIEYFIEGGRSRHGRMLSPKTGLLSMTMRSFLRAHERPLAFVPVYVGYEKLLEGDSYVAELAGKPKQGESLGGLLRTVRLLRQRFGRVHVNFGRPLDLGGFLDRVRPGWQDEGGPAAPWVREATHRLAEEMARRINEAAVPNPLNLAALALLATPGQAAGERQLTRLIDHWQALFAGLPRGETAVDCSLDTAKIIHIAEKLGGIERLADPLGDLLRVAPGETVRLAYFRNNLLHLAALPSFVACLLSRNQRLLRDRLEAAVAALYPFLRAELFLPWPEEDVPALLGAALDTLKERGLLTGRDDAIEAPPPAAAEAADLHSLGEPIRPLLERQYLVLAQLARMGSGRASRADLEAGCARIAHRQALLNETEAGGTAAPAQITALVSRFLEAGLMREDESGLLHFATAAADHADLSLSAQTREAIRMGGEETWAAGKDGPVEPAPEETLGQTP